jgi:hypothetical protein
MFRFLKKPAEVIDHWYVLVPNFNLSTKEFYADIEAELKMREVPSLEIAHVDFAEGGLASAKREYLRLNRERLVFDVCAAPFGTAYFFSCRFAEIPSTIKLWQLMLMIIPPFFIACLSWHFAGLVMGSIILIAIFGIIAYTLRNAVAMGLRDLDAYLMKDPMFGPTYERFFRKETYYRHDTRLMYCDIVNAVVKAKVEEASGAKGIKLIKFNEYSPIWGELYKPITVQLAQKVPVS